MSSYGPPASRRCARRRSFPSGTCSSAMWPTSRSREPRVPRSTCKQPSGSKPGRTSASRTMPRSSSTTTSRHSSSAGQRATRMRRPSNRVSLASSSSPVTGRCASTWPPPRRRTGVSWSFPARARRVRSHLVKLADSLQEQGRLPEAEEAYDEGLSALRSAGDAHAAAVAMLGLARALWRHGYTTRARSCRSRRSRFSSASRGPDLVSPTSALPAPTRSAGDRTKRWRGPRRQSPLPGELGYRKRRPQPPDAWLGAHQSRRHPPQGWRTCGEALALSLRLGLGIETANLVPQPRRDGRRVREPGRGSGADSRLRSSSRNAAD